MSFVGKILVVLQVVLTICFMTFAAAVFATHKNWKEKNTETETALTQAQSDLNRLRIEMKEADTNTKATIGDLTRERDTLQANLKANGELLAAQQKREQDFENVMLFAQNEATAAGEESKDRITESDMLRQRYNELIDDRHDTFQQMTKLKDTLTARDLENANLVAAVKDNLKKMAPMIFALKKFGVDDPERLARAKEPPPRVTGDVERVLKSRQGAAALIEVSIGSDDGVRVGIDLDVYRGGKSPKYLGKARVVDVSTDKSVLEVSKSAKSGLIKKGDHVTTKL